MFRDYHIRISPLWTFGTEMNDGNQEGRCRDIYDKQCYIKEFYCQGSYNQRLNQGNGERSDSVNAIESSLDEKDVTVEKPPMSYVALITMAIKNSSDGRLTLSEIYDYLIKNFKFFRTTRSRGWMNAVRHNLTLNDCFVKLPRDPLMRGKGSFWCIDPESTGMFNHGSLKRRRTRYKRARDEVEVIKDIMSKKYSGNSYVHANQQRRRAPYCGSRTFSLVNVEGNPPKKKFSNFSIDAILAKDPAKKCNRSKPMFKFCSTEVWQ